jgi:MoxR-like ATPase
MSGKVEDETPLLGYILGKHLVRTPFREAYEHGGLFLIDEFCASNPNAVNAINAALANGYCAFPDGIVKRHANFICIAADNTDGSGPTARYPGRNVLDGASLDRFAMIDWDYDLDLERKLGAAQPQWTRYVQALRVMADNHAMGALITPRATIKGGMMLSAGMAWDDVATAYLWRKMSKDDARRLQAQVDDTEYRTQSNAAAIAA